MQICIEIPDAMYEDIKSGKDGYSNYVHTAIRNGIPIPKGHGRLIDADEFLKENNCFVLLMIKNHLRKLMIWQSRH